MWNIRFTFKTGEPPNRLLYYLFLLPSILLKELKKIEGNYLSVYESYILGK